MSSLTFRTSSDRLYCLPLIRRKQPRTRRCVQRWRRPQRCGSWSWLRGRRRQRRLKSKGLRRGCCSLTAVGRNAAQSDAAKKRNARAHLAESAGSPQMQHSGLDSLLLRSRPSHTLTAAPRAAGKSFAPCSLLLPPTSYRLAPRTPASITIDFGRQLRSAALLPRSWRQCRSGPSEGRLSPACRLPRPYRGSTS